MKLGAVFQNGVAKLPIQTVTKYWKYDWADSGKRYKKVGWIENNAESYINTGVVPTLQTGVVVDYTPYGAGSIFGVARTSGYQYFGVHFTTSKDYELYLGASGSSRGGSSNYNVRQTLSMNMNSNKSLYLNGTKIIERNATSLSTSTPIYLFRLSGDYVQTSNAKLYSCQIYSSSTLVRNFIPALDTQTNKAGLYDLVNNAFYGNSGTGDFSYEEPIPLPATEDDYDFATQGLLVQAPMM